LFHRALIAYPALSGALAEMVDRFCRQTAAIAMSGHPPEPAAGMAASGRNADGRSRPIADVGGVGE